MTSEFDRQLDQLVALDYPGLAGLDEDSFRELIEPLRAITPLAMADEQSNSHVPWVIVVDERLISPEPLIPLLRLAGGTRPGVLDRNFDEGLASYRPLDALGVPSGGAYLLVGIDRGEEFCNVRPEDALPVITGRGRTPLTISEGIALVTQYPRVLERNKCFMLSGSRRQDRRVPALWISTKAPKLGWCWDGNPHTWLGTASAASRIAKDPG
jgi:hypothetical protein